MELKEIQVGDTYKNWKNETNVITNISKTGLVITTKNSETGNISKFRFYEASGKYIKNGTPNTDLGKYVNYESK